MDPAAIGYGGLTTDMDRGHTVKRMLSTAAILIGLAVVLTIVALVLRALRWLLIVAAVVLVIGAFVGYRGRSSAS